MYNYDGLYELLKQRNLNKSDLVDLLHISSRTIAKISKDEPLSPFVIKKLTNFFSCEESDIYIIVTDNPLLQQLKDEKNHRISGGFYHELQIRMTYNSNHIEGSTLSEEQTRRIFETSTLDGSDGLPVDDIIETVNHFRAIDYCIDIAEEPLTEEIIKKLHYLVKRGTKDETLSWFQVGEYKSRPNVVGGMETSSPEDVASDMKALLAAYHKKKKISLEEIIDFHFRFEGIHPFQEGNGRVGRLIAFKECLHHKLVPFIIEDRKKYFYYRGLREYLTDPGYLIGTCYDGQDTVRGMLELFDMKN
ncbi:Fic family protein [Kallipyga massiliensis]|uniref:Fic family protein n=1 Tax=Kallipyga massiliensis TaxID=1472764 RepID=UPI0004B821B1|nr:Fic family protein [Kallipyga massiliensis]